jgi:hypothetical protein
MGGTVYGIKSDANYVKKRKKKQWKNGRVAQFGRASYYHFCENSSSLL